MNNKDINLIFEAYNEKRSFTGTNIRTGEKRKWEDGEEVEVEAGGASAKEMNAHRQLVDGLRSGMIELKETDIQSGTVVVSTGDDLSIVLKVMGFEGGHDIPVSMRPDPHEGDRGERHGGDAYGRSDSELPFSR